MQTNKQMLKEFSNGYYFYRQKIFRVIDKSDENINAAIEHIEKSIDAYESRRIAHTFCGERFKLLRLAIHVTNTCNLRCRYCYASGGSYGSNEEIMTLEMANRLQKFIDHHIESVKVIHFFGGEPTLNPDIIDFFCQRNSGVKFTLITNGTILNERIITLIKEHQIDIAVSVDGPEELHNLNRVYANGTPSFSKVIANLNIMQKTLDQPKSIEGTITNATLKTTTLVELHRFFFNNFNIRLMHFPQVSMNEFYREQIDLTLYRNQYRDLIKDMFNSLSRDDNKYSYINYFVLGIVSDLVDGRIQQYICPAASGTISVSHDGEFYPCFMFNKNSVLKLGSVDNFNSEEFHNRRTDITTQALRKNIIKKEPEWYDDAFYGCMGAMFHDKGNFKATEDDLKSFEIIFETVIEQFIEIKEDPRKYQNFISNLSFLQNEYRKINI